MPGMVTLPVPMGGMMVGAFCTTGVAVVPGAAALLMVVAMDPDGPSAGADAGAAAAPIVAVLVPDVPVGVLAAAFAKAAAVAAAAASAPGRVDPLGLAAGLASVTHHAGAAASNATKRHASTAHGRDGTMSVMRPAGAPGALPDSQLRLQPRCDTSRRGPASEQAADHEGSRGDAAVAGGEGGGPQSWLRGSTASVPAPLLLCIPFNGQTADADRCPAGEPHAGFACCTRSKFA